MEINSSIDEINKKKQEANEKSRQLQEDLKLAAKELFKDNNGKMFLKYLKEICLWDEVNLNINNEILIYKKGRRDIWSIIRSILPKDVLAQIEIFED